MALIFNSRDPHRPQVGFIRQFILLFRISHRPARLNSLEFLTPEEVKAAARKLLADLQTGKDAGHFLLKKNADGKAGYEQIFQMDPRLIERQENFEHHSDPEDTLKGKFAEQLVAYAIIGHYYLWSRQQTSSSTRYLHYYLWSRQQTSSSTRHMLDVAQLSEWCRADRLLRESLQSRLDSIRIKKLPLSLPVNKGGPAMWVEEYLEWWSTKQCVEAVEK